MQDDRSLPGQGCACGEKSGVEASGGRILGNLGFPGKQDFPDQFQFRVPAFEFVGIVYAGKLQQAREGLGAADDLAGPDGKACVAVEGHLPLGKMADEAIQQGHEVVFGEEPIKPSATITAGGRSGCY
jgi:hypothetical protein